MNKMKPRRVSFLAYDAYHSINLLQAMLATRSNRNDKGRIVWEASEQEAEAVFSILKGKYPALKLVGYVFILIASGKNITPVTLLIEEGEMEENLYAF
jgi:hypothetical protein